jgi:gliding motility-associated-like protein
MDSRIVRRFAVVFIFTTLVCRLFAQSYQVTGGAFAPLLAENNTTARIQIYLVYGMSNVQLSYTSSSTTHQWYRYRMRALDDSERVTSTQNGTTSFVTNPEEGYGYYVRENENIGMNQFVWIMDYRNYEFFIRSLHLAPNMDECIAIGFDGDADAPDMVYYTPAGTQTTLRRTFELNYETLRWDASQRRFLPEFFTKTFNTHPFSTTFPLHSDDPKLLADTELTLKGDLFARHFGVEKSISIPYQAKALQVYADTLIVSSASNDFELDEVFQAPTVILFQAYANLPVASRVVWKIYNSEYPDNLLVNFSGAEVEYTFNRAGTFIARLEVSDRTGTCALEADEEYIFIIQITETELTIPNAFSPGTTPGINDIFKVRYKSLIDFKGWIFNRWGTELFHWTDPSQGWDGKYRGQYVPAGAYYYLIEYTGTDGRRRKRTGDVNVFRGRNVETEVFENK